MANTDETFDLIKSLSKSEKRHFRLNAQQTAGDKNYLKVFDVLKNMEVYDSKALNKKFQSSGLNLSHEKNYLQASILKLLRNNPAEEAFQHGVLLAAAESEVLFAKGLVDMSLDTLAKAKAKALRYEYFALYMMLLTTERNIYIQAAERKGIDRLITWSKEYEDAIGKQENLAEYVLMNTQLHLLMRSEEPTHKKVVAAFRKALASGSMKDVSQAKSATAVMFFYQHRFSYYMLTGKTREAVEYSRLLCNHMEQTMLAERSPLSYLNLIFNHIILLKNLCEFKEVETWLDKLENFPIPKTHSQGSLLASLKFAKTAGHKLELAIQTGEFAAGLALIAPTRKAMAGYTTINDFYKVILQYNFAVLYFCAEKYTEAIREFQPIISDRNEIGQDYRNYAKLMLLLAHSEKGNTEILPYVYKQLKLSTLTGIQQEIAGFILAESSPEAFLPTYRKHPEKVTAQNYFPFEAWLTGKVEKIPLAQAVKRLNKK